MCKRMLTHDFFDVLKDSFRWEASWKKSPKKLEETKDMGGWWENTRYNITFLTSLYILECDAIQLEIG